MKAAQLSKKMRLADGGAICGLASRYSFSVRGWHYPWPDRNADMVRCEGLPLLPTPCAQLWRKVRLSHPQVTHNSRALLNANELTRRVFSSRISVRVIGGSARWLQFSRSQSRQLTPIGVPSAFSRSMPVA